jgi:hypothetical protein
MAIFSEGIFTGAVGVTIDGPFGGVATLDMASSMCEKERWEVVFDDLLLHQIPVEVRKLCFLCNLFIDPQNTRVLLSVCKAVPAVSLSSTADTALAHLSGRYFSEDQ